MKARKPLLEAAVVGVDIVDMEAEAPRGQAFPGRNGVKGDVRVAGKGCEVFAPIADQGLCGLTTPANAVAIEALSSCGRTASKVAPFRSRATRMGDVVLVKARMAGRSAAFRALLRWQIGPSALEGF